MRGRGQIVIATLVAAAIGVGAVALGRLEPRDRPPAMGGIATSAAWICPHGGGQGWSATILLANPTADPATARISVAGTRGPEPPTSVDVAPGTTATVDVDAGTRAASTFVESFGASLAVGWVLRAGGDDRGIGAEPCAPGGKRVWFVADGAAEEGEETYVVVANPFATDAVVDVALFASGRQPIRDSTLTNLAVPGRDAVAVRLGRLAAGDPVIGTLVQARVGRVGAAALGTGAAGIRSTIGATTAATTAILPFALGSGQASIEVFDPGGDPATLGAVSLSAAEATPIEEMANREQESASAAGYPVSADGAAAVELTSTGPMASAIRATGSRGDAASTAGAVEASGSWVVLPASIEPGASTTLVLVNPGLDAVTVTLRLVPLGEGAPAEATVSVPARTVALAPSDLLGSTAAAVVVRCEAGAVVAASAAATGDEGQGPAGFAISLGVPIPG